MAFSVTVDPATAILDSDASVTVKIKLEGGNNFAYLCWYKSNADGVPQGDRIISTDPNKNKDEDNGRYSLSNDQDLRISKVTLEDAGHYLCRVNTSNGRMIDGFEYLTVHYLETPVLKPKEEMTVNENGTATFTCTLSNGVPTPDITWIKDGVELDVSDTEKYPHSEKTLEISRVNEKDEGDYQCRAENTAYSGNKGKLSNTGTLSVLKEDCLCITIVLVLTVVACFPFGIVLIYCYYAKKLCFSKKGRGRVSTSDPVPSDDVEMDKAEGKSDFVRYQASGGELYTQVNLEGKKKKPDSDNGSKPAPVDVNVEGLQYADLDLSRNCPAGKQDVINHPDSETMYSSITHQI